MNLGALKSSNFRAYVAGSAFGLLAIWMQRITVGWLAWDMTGSATLVGAVAFFMFAPSIVLSPLFGVWVDRMNVKRAVLVVQTLNAALSAALWLAVAADVATPFLLMCFSVLLGVVMAANHPVRMALTPRLVRREFVGSVVTIVAINFNIARMIGPAVGGVLIAQIGVAHTLLVQWLLFLPYLLVLSRLTLRPRRDTGSAQEPFFKALATGVRFVWQTLPVREAMFVAGVLAVVARGALEILPPLADGVFNRGASGLGLLMSVTGVGAILGGFSQALLPPQEPGRLPLSTRLAIVIGLVMVVALGAAQTWELALVVAAAMSFVTTVTAISTQTAIQLDLEDDMRGRVMSLWAVIAAGGSALGAGMMGILADAIGLQKALIFTGSFSTVLVGGYFALVWVRRGL
ncbi:MFS transporter [Shimia haliotis]|uniref:Predicted arabinose efflux permease, MFS family n=1 Tax=Shimia haliotis TaxID=1280847 RepID=A0A1I4DHV9_9RHOB|nr:MFS transporter [Shimia haliotis]SFK92805.1 Predicted arabinose efflux permease, MFS family [Shimia haliotis]